MTLVLVTLKAADKKTALVKFGNHCYHVKNDLLELRNGEYYLETRFMSRFNRVRVTNVRQSDLEWQRKAKAV